MSFQNAKVENIKCRIIPQNPKTPTVWFLMIQRWIY
jgi:hypothetical protein